MKRTIWLVVTFAAVAVGWSYAGEVEMMAEAAEAAQSPQMGGVLVQGSVTDWAELDDSGGDIRYSGFGIMANFMFFNFGYAQKHFEWENVDKLPFGDGVNDPWDELYEINFGLGYGGPVTDKWNWFGEAGVFSAHEQDVDGSFGYYMAAGAGYAVNSDWSVTLGAAGAGYRRVQSKWSMFPILGINWREEAEDGFSAMLGYPESIVTYHFCKRASLSVFIGNDGTVYRLDDDSAVAAEGYMETDFTVAGTSFDYALTESVSLGLSVDYVVDGTLQTYDSDGDKLERYDVGSTTRGMLTATWGF